MTRQEAQELLRVCRPNGRDAKSPVFAEALALAERDPDLKAWWQSQQAFDAGISAKLKAVPIPADLRSRLLTGEKGKVVPIRSPYRLPAWFAIAAIFMILGVILVPPLFETQALAQQIPAAKYDKSAIAFLGDDAPSLATMSDSQEKLKEWLKQQNSPVGAVPDKMQSVPTVGCQTFKVQGHAVSLICFALAEGEIVHLFVVEKEALSDPPGSTPAFSHDGPWSMATWSDAGHSYLLATEAGGEKLKQLL